MEQDDLLKNPAFRNMSQEKLMFLKSFLLQTKPASSNEMMAFLMSFMQRARQNDIQFSKEETDYVIGELKKSLSEKEQQKITLIQQMMNRMHPHN